MIRVGILGASGFVGAELLRLCALHPDLRPVKLFGSSQAGQRLADVHPHLALAYPETVVNSYADDALDGLDLVFAALPHGESQILATKIVDSGTFFVDLGADFRLDSPEDYALWYGEKHRCAALLPTFAYGIPELHREAIARSKAVAAAGCYATAAILALKPLMGLIEPGSLVVDAASGVSGAGKGLKEATHFNSVDESFAPSALLTHRHTAEMQLALGAELLFTPHLAPMNRGILATCHGLAKGPCDPLEALRTAYAGEPFIHVSERIPATKWTQGSNAVHLTAR
jgi:N-acetyl-gamma-glutamyl-phosphate reductase